MWFLVGVVLFIIIIAAATLGWHLLLPGHVHWLNDAELQDVKNFILSGAIVGLGTHYVRQFLEPRHRHNNSQDV